MEIDRTVVEQRIVTLKEMQAQLIAQVNMTTGQIQALEALLPQPAEQKEE